MVQTETMEDATGRRSDSTAMTTAIECQLSFRPVEEEDSRFIYSVYASTRTAELARTGWTEEQKEAFLAMQFRAQTLHYRQHYGDAEHTIIMAGGVPAGRLYIARGQEEIHIVDIALLPQWRNRGIGTALLQSLLKESSESQKPVTIHVETYNPAMTLYRRLGFCLAEDQGIYQLMKRAPAPKEEIQPYA